MDNHKIVSSFLMEKGLFPKPENAENGGLCLSVKGNQLCLQGDSADFIALADLLVSLALSGEAQGQHWHVDELSLLDEASEIPELILLRK